MADGFLNRWSRRKLEVRGGKQLAEPEVTSTKAAVAGITPGPPETRDARQANALVVEPVALPQQAALPPDGLPVELPTLADVQGLTPDSDFKPFMARGVTAEVKNAAMKKLFADPHFNRMDRLDTYIDDYSLPDPIPESMLRQMVSAKFLNLFGDQDKPAIGAADETTPELPRDDANTPEAEVVAQSISALENQPTISTAFDQAPTPTVGSEQKATHTHHDDLDLRLQPDHAAAAQGAGRGTA